MDSIRQEGKTVEDAIKKGLKKLGIVRDEASIEIVEEESGGLFGLIGGRKAVVDIEKKKDPVEIGKKFLENIFATTTLEVEVSIIEEETNDEQVLYNINSPDLGIIIGHRGETLDALQYLTSLVVNRNVNEYFRVLLDAEGYRERRKQTLIRLANKLARKAVEKGRKVVLEPMPPHERRIIHMAIKEDSRVKSHSEGEEPFRKVIIEQID
ncbi:MAG: RNA-binding cell elongation regulator Jag/EloR [Halanaerobiales bacterium]